MNIFGVDIGGTGIKAAIVNTLTGELISEHKRI
ncbi:MAG: ROK family protein, partial [Tolumonas sp.]